MGIYLLQFGYFKSHHLFFVFDLPEVEVDVGYIQQQYFPSFQLRDLRITKVNPIETAKPTLSSCSEKKPFILPECLTASEASGGVSNWNGFASSVSIT